VADAGSPSPDPPPPLLQFRSLSMHSTQLVARYWLRTPSPSLRRRTHPKMRRHEPVGSFTVDPEVFLAVPRTRARRLAPFTLRVTPATGFGHRTSRMSPLARRSSTYGPPRVSSPSALSDGCVHFRRDSRRAGPGLPPPVRSVSRASHPPDVFLRNHPCRLVSSGSRPWGYSLQSLLTKSRNASRRPLPS